jgi:hypothetical protein
MTPTAGPASAIQAFVNIDEGTPFPNVPINFGAVVATSDANGLIQVNITSDTVADVSSNISAIKIESIAGTPVETLTGSAAEIAQIATRQGGVLDIVTSRRVNPEALCRVFDSELGVEAIRFPFTNRYGEALSVSSQGLNSIESVSGVPYPIASFGSTDSTKPDGYLGFTWSLDYFKWFDPARNQEVVSASWTLLGKQISVDAPQSDIPICSQAGEFGGCAAFNDTLTNRIYEQALSSVTRLSNQALTLKIKGVWRPIGKVRTPYYNSAARSLRNIRVLLRLPTSRYVCAEAVPQSCRTVVFPKSQLQSEFDKIFKVKLPSGLRSLVRLLPAERKKFQAELKKLPSSYVTCEQ